MKNLFLLLIVACFSLQASAQTNLDSLSNVMLSDAHDTTKVNAALQKAAALERFDHNAAIDAASWALKKAQKVNYMKGVYQSYYALASTHYERKQPSIMHLYIDSMMQMDDPVIDEEMRADAYNLLGIAHYDEAELIEAITAWEEARMLYGPENRAGVISNIGNIYLSSDELEKAAGYFLEAAEINERVGHHQFLMVNYFNLAACHEPKDSLVIHYLRKSEMNARKAGYLRALPDLYDRIIRYYAENREFKKATAALDSMRVFNTDSAPEFVSYYYNPVLAFYRYHLAKAKLVQYDNSLTDALDAELPARDLLEKSASVYSKNLMVQSDMRSMAYDHQVLADIYKELGDYEASVKSFQLSLAYKDSMAINKAQFILKEYERNQQAVEKRERELRTANERQQQRFRFYSALAGSGVMIILALGLWSRLRFTRKSKAVLQKEKERSEELLLNILPEEVAEELKDKGYSDAQLIDQVTVLFTDFKGFTALSEQVTPKELVADLHECFSAFDRICEKYGIEKIKTIGDAYMAAGGLPSPNTTHAQDVVNAALEMRVVVEKGKMKKVEQGLPFFEIRIGVHTGPVVAGIVGVKKFQYDIWGDTVNTASRMESSGAIGKVNISEATYNLLNDDSQFTFESRGKVEAKGKGEMEMYFVERFG